MASPGDPSRKAINTDIALPSPAPTAGTGAESPPPAAERQPEPGRADRAREAGRKGGTAPHRAEEILRNIGAVQGDVTRLREDMGRLPGTLEERFRTLLDERLAPLEALLVQFLDTLCVSSAAVTADEPAFADPAKVSPITPEQYARAAKAWKRQLVHSSGAPFAEQATAVLDALAGPSSPPDLALRRAVAAAGVVAFVENFSDGYPETLALADAERLYDETATTVPDATKLTETEYEYYLGLGIKER